MQHISGILLNVFIFILSVLVLSSLSAQQTIPATGGDASSPDGSVSYTVGQIDYLHETNANGSSNQGVQHPCEGEDDIPPFAACQDLTVQLDSNGIVHIQAFQVDAGTSDNCKLDSIMVFPDTFHCADVGDNDVTLTVTDASGNSSSCIATVTVEDQVAPEARCSGTSVVLDSTGMAYLSPGDIDDGSTDACGIDSMFLSTASFDCSDIGSNTVTLTVVDNNGNSSTCTATVIVTDNTPPQIICSPADTVYADFNCDKAIPNYLNDITVSDNCNNIFDTYQDPVPGTTLPPGMHDITLTAWDESLNASTCIVELTVIDQKDPVLSCPGPDTIQTMNCTAFLPDYRVQDSVTDNCQVYVPLEQDPAPGSELMPGTHTVTVTATDDAGNTDQCSFELTVEEHTGPLGIECPEDDTLSAGAGCQAMLPDYTDEAMVTGNCGNGDTVSQSPAAGTPIPIGLHTLTLTATDDQGNTATCTMTVEVEDTQAPIASCEDATISINQGEQYVLSTSEIEAGSSDNCGIDTSWLSQHTFTCADAGDQTVTLTVVDNSGNSSSCTATVTIACIQPEHSLSGTIANPWSTGVEDVTVDISGSQSGTATTDQQGDYSQTVNSGANVTLKPEKDINYAEGVSTVDLIQIQMHILHLDTLELPEQLIAADASNNQQISTFDLVQLQLVVVGLSSDLPNNSSWRFVRSDYVFPDPDNPWMEPWPEDTTLNNVSADISGLDFTAIKIGDINGSYTPSLQGGTSTADRTGDYAFTLKDRRVQAGEQIEVWFSPEEAEKLMGYQSSLQFNTEALQFKEVLTAETLPGLNENMFNTREAENGKLHFNYWSVPGQSVQREERAFGLRFAVRSTSSGQRLSDLLSLTADRLAPEAYIGGDVRHLQLRFIEAEETSFVLYPNRPNPFEEGTIISFDLPESSEVDLTIMDAAGRLLQERTIDGRKGYNTFEIQGGNLSEGVLYYRVATDEHSAVQKMILQR